MNETFQDKQPVAAGLTRRLPVSRRFPHLPWWLGQILPAPRSGAAPPRRQSAPLPRALAPVAPQADRSPPVASLPDRLPGRGDPRQRLEARSERRGKHHSAVVNNQVDATSHPIPLPTVPARLGSSILPLSPVLPASRAWRSIQTESRTAPHQPASDAQPLSAHSEFRSQSASGAILLHQPPRPRVEIEDDGHREYSIDLAR